MSLLTNVMEHSLDDGYAEAAARRSAAGLPRTLGSKLGLAAGLVLAAVVVTIGAAQARVSAPEIAKEREELIERVEERGSGVEQLESRVEALRQEVDAEQRRALEAGGGSENGELLRVLSGAVPVKGPGVKLVVDDADQADQGGGGPRESNGFSDSGRVHDRDLQWIVNGLWESGAEAIAVNGQRLTALSAIRAAGDAVLVDNKPLVPPYTVLAVGGAEQLLDAFWSSADGQYLKVLQKEYGVRADLSAQQEVRLPAAPSLTIRHAAPRDPADNKSTADTEKDTS